MSLSETSRTAKNIPVINTVGLLFFTIWKRGKQTSKQTEQQQQQQQKQQQRKTPPLFPGHHDELFCFREMWKHLVFYVPSICFCFLLVINSFIIIIIIIFQTGILSVVLITITVLNIGCVPIFASEYSVINCQKIFLAWKHSLFSYHYNFTNFMIKFCATLYVLAVMHVQLSLCS